MKTKGAIQDAWDRRLISIIVAMLVGGLLAALIVEADVPLQFNAEGWTSHVQPLVAAVMYPLAAFVTWLLTKGSSVIWLPWVGRSLVLLMASVEFLAFISAT